MEPKLTAKEADKIEGARSRILLWVLIMLVFLALLAGLMLLLGWLANQAGEGI
jgi:flagellar basal body-associated protein FliL